MALMDVLTAEEVAARSNGEVATSDSRMVPYLTDALAQAALYAPCLQSDAVSPLRIAQAKGIIADAVLRRFHRDDQSQDVNMASETWTAGPLGRTINFADNTGAGLPLLTKADRDQLASICRSRKPSSVAIAMPTTNDPTQEGWPTGYRIG